MTRTLALAGLVLLAAWIVRHARGWPPVVDDGWREDDDGLVTFA